VDLDAAGGSPAFLSVAEDDLVRPRAALPR
jgi:hypothetical protein